MLERLVRLKLRQACRLPCLKARSRGKSCLSVVTGAGLPFAEILLAEQIERIFAKYGCSFGIHDIYSTAMMVWSFLSQVLRDGKEASCQAAVARVVSYCQLQGLHSPSEDTGDYCRAKAKLSEAALRELSCEVAEGLDQATNAKWLRKGKLHAKLIDGFTFTIPDTAKNQTECPQQNRQSPGVGPPIARALAITSLTTACVMNLTLGPFWGTMRHCGRYCATLWISLECRIRHPQHQVEP